MTATTKSQQTRRRPGRRQQQRQITEHAILTAAATEFSIKNFNGSSLNAIAKVSGISKPNIIYYYKTKEALWEATVEHVFTNALSDIHSTYDRLNPQSPGTLVAFIRDYFDACRKHPAYVLIPMVEGVASSWRTTHLAEKYLAINSQSFQEFLQVITGQNVSVQSALHIQNLIAGGAQLYLGLAPLWLAATGADTTQQSFIDDYANLVLSAVESIIPSAVNT